MKSISLLITVLVVVLVATQAQAQIGIPVGIPPVGIPPVGIPPVGIPPVGIPPVGIPPVGIPPVGIPPVGIPPVGLPPVGLPPVALISVLNVTGLVTCSVNVSIGGPPTAPPFPNALVQLSCGGTVIGSNFTDQLGQFTIYVNQLRAIITNLLSSCKVVVVTPLATCNATLPLNGTLQSPLQFVGNTVDGVLNVTNAIASLFALVVLPPIVGIPPVGIPPVGIPPSVGIPPVGIPPVGIPPLGIPPVGIPPLGIPPVGIPPSVGIPPIGLPPIVLPPIGIPPIGLFPLLNITGVVFCSVNASTNGTVNGTSTTAPPFANALVELNCGGNVIASALTSQSGRFNIIVYQLLPVIRNVLSSCKVVVATPLVNCNATLPSNGTLQSSLQLTGNTVRGLLNIVNAIAALFVYINV